MIRMKMTIITFTISMLSMCFIKQNAEGMLGKWIADEDKKKVVEIYLAKDGFYYGRDIGSTEDGKGKFGHLIFQKCTYETKTETLNGTMQPPDKKIDLAVTIQLEKNGKLRVVAKKFFMTKTLYFSKLIE
jgi:hypothetical protein